MIVRIFLLFIGAIIGNAQEWTPLYQGIDYRFEVIESVENKVLIHQARINLQSKGVEFMVTPPAKIGVNYTCGSHTKVFLEQFGLKLAINGGAYHTVKNDENEIIKTSVNLVAAEGVIYSLPGSEDMTFVVTKDGNVNLLKNDEIKSQMHNIQLALGGWKTKAKSAILVENFDISDTLKNDFFPDLDTRTAIGISAEGTYLYLIVADNIIYYNILNKEKINKGLNLHELAQIMKDLGCERAMNLDGGGSSAMAIMDKKLGKGITVNTPSDNKHRDGRVVATHLGIRALEL